MTTEKTKKNEKKYLCENCDYYTYKKTDFKRHCDTIKHKNNVLTTFSNAQITQNSDLKKYSCKFCDRKYNDRAGLWRHKKSCMESKEPTDKELIMLLLKQNTQLIEQNSELVKTGSNCNITNNNNNNSYNKTFNLQIFLNEKCKDAMNLMEFVDTIKIQLSDLIQVGETGYVEGITNIITTNLNALDITQRPIHCTDKKRETLYIKDDNKWEKEDESKKKIRKAIKVVAHKNVKALPAFTEKYPDCKKSDSKVCEQYTNLIMESTSGSEVKEDTIIKNISKHVIIEKE